MKSRMAGHLNLRSAEEQGNKPYENSESEDEASDDSTANPILAHKLLSAEQLLTALRTLKNEIQQLPIPEPASFLKARTLGHSKAASSCTNYPQTAKYARVKKYQRQTQKAVAARTKQPPAVRKVALAAAHTNLLSRKIIDTQDDYKYKLLMEKMRMNVRFQGKLAQPMQVSSEVKKGIVRSMSRETLCFHSNFRKKPRRKRLKEQGVSQPLLLLQQAASLYAARQPPGSGIRPSHDGHMSMTGTFSLPRLPTASKGIKQIDQQNNLSPENVRSPKEPGKRVRSPHTQS